MRQERYRRKRRRENYAVRFILGTVILTVVFLGLILACAGLDFLQPVNGVKEDHRPTARVVNAAGLEEDEKVKNEIRDGELYSRTGILVRLSDGAVMAQYNPKERIYPASLTKIMTCIVVLEHTDDLNKPVTIDGKTYNELYEQEASMAGFFPGEEARVIDLLYGSILPSGGECSAALAGYVSGLESSFVELMNEKAEELGMNRTHFVNATGLHDEEQYSTVEDMAELLKYALQNETFREIFCCRSYQVPSTNQHLGGFTIESSVFSLRDDWIFENGEILGGKTGFTDQAGLCLATLAVVGGEEYIAITAGAEGDHSTEPWHVYDAFYLYRLIEAFD